MEKKLTKKEQEVLTIKENICESLEIKKIYNFDWSEETWYAAKIKAGSQVEAKEKWGNGDYDTHIHQTDYIEDSLEIVEDEE